MPLDPNDEIATSGVRIPPAAGPGSGRAAWVAFAREMVDINKGLVAVIERQRAAIRERDAEIELLRRRIATRRPKGGRDPLPRATVDRIEYEVAEGGSDRHVARRYGVSHMTVNRIRRRMAERRQLAEVQAA